MRRILILEATKEPMWSFLTHCIRHRNDVKVLPLDLDKDKVERMIGQARMGYTVDPTSWYVYAAADPNQPESITTFMLKMRSEAVEGIVIPAHHTRAEGIDSVVEYVHQTLRACEKVLGPDTRVAVITTSRAIPSGCLRGVATTYGQPIQQIIATSGSVTPQLEAYLLVP